MLDLTAVVGYFYSLTKRRPAFCLLNLRTETSVFYSVFFKTMEPTLTLTHRKYRSKCPPYGIPGVEWLEMSNNVHHWETTSH